MKSCMNLAPPARFLFKGFMPHAIDTNFDHLGTFYLKCQAKYSTTGLARLKDVSELFFALELFLFI